MLLEGIRLLLVSQSSCLFQEALTPVRGESPDCKDHSSISGQRPGQPLTVISLAAPHLYSWYFTSISRRRKKSFFCNMEPIFISCQSPAFMPIYMSSDSAMFSPKYSRPVNGITGRNQKPFLHVTTELPLFQVMEIPISLYRIIPCPSTKIKRK